MITTILDDPMTFHPPAGGSGGEFGNARDSDPILLELGACRWSGTVTPLRAHVKPPAPNRLAEFERGGINWFESVYPQDLERVHKNIADVVRGETCPAFEYRMVTGKDTIVWVRHWWSTERRPGGQVDGFVQVIDERKELEAECIRAGERERHQIGQELHDDVCQVFAGLACMLELFGRKVKTAIPTLTPTVNEMVSELNGGMARARSLAHGLVPLRLAGLGLTAALAELARQTATSRGITVGTHFGRNLRLQSPEQILHLYRIAQEAIGNAVKHGHATRIELSLRRRGGRVSFTVRDNGDGLPPAATRTPGLGLHIMHYRAVAIGADFSIMPGLAGGTVITVNCPSAALRPRARALSR